MSEPDEYVQKFVDFVNTQNVTGELRMADVAQTRSREELGISSLNIILIVANYIKQSANGGLAFRPEWVARLDDVDGIVSVLREIDASCLANTAAE
jgi:hypothetical protein